MLAVPRIEPHRPPPGPAIIARVVADSGYDVTLLDLNIKFFHWCRQHGLDFYSFDGVWDRQRDLTLEQQQVLDQFVDHWVQVIINSDYQFILISVFGISGTYFTRLLLQQLRPRTRAQIIVGGMGAGSVDLVDSERCFGRTLQEQGLIDIFVTGEGEQVILSAMAGQSGPGINNNHPVQINDIDDLTPPDYSFFDLGEYDYLVPGQRDVYITGSRGCVRRCTYCDIERYWPKYRYRSGRSIADEIIMQYERHGITRFYFTDSLINGSLKAFTDMCEQLSRYQFDKPISWSGQFIFRDRKSVPRDHFAMIKSAGGNQFYVGIETGSDRVRFEMGKKFTNEDIDFQLQECSRFGINIMPLMFTGYITEKLQDHQDNLACFSRWQRYVADGTINGVELGSNLLILPGAPVERMIESHGIHFILDDDRTPVLNLWNSQSNPDLTTRERIRRKIEIHETAMRYAWPVWRQKSRLADLKALIEKYRLWDDQNLRFFPVPDDHNPSKPVIPIKTAGELG